MIPDSEQRKKAVMTDRHAFVWASAGTGKTHTLTLRALFLLLMAPHHERATGTDCEKLYTAERRAERLRAARAVVRKFVLTTFTRKAAAEMQTRLYEYLDRLASSGSMDELRAEVAKMNSGYGDDQFLEVVEAAMEKTGDFGRLRGGAEALAELATELQVYTLHSYAAAVLRRHPIAAGIAPTAQFAEEDDATAVDPAEQLVDRWWQHTLADKTLSRQLERLLDAVPLQELKNWLIAIVGQPWIVREMDIGKPDEEALKEILCASEMLVVALDGARSNWTSIIAARELLRGVLSKVQHKQKGAWTEFCAALLQTEGAIFGAESKFVQDAIATLGKLALYYENFEVAYVPVLQKCLATEMADTWREWRNFTEAFARWADGAVVRELNLVTFDEMVRRAEKLLATNSDVRREERARLWSLLVDEFQDTDPVQLSLLRHLLARESRKDHEVIGFFVGDPKQSIYRFRDADLPAIQAFVESYPRLAVVGKGEVESYRLTSSFRSLKPITDFVNHFFAHVVSLPTYEKEVLEPVCEGVGKVPEWRLVQGNGEAGNADERRELAAQETARLIEEYVRETGNGHSAYSDIVVLVNTHDELDALLPVLEKAGIPAVSSGAKKFYQKPEVLDALNLLISLHNPQDSLAIGALLRSPLFGLSDPQIYKLLRETKARSIFTDDKPLPSIVPREAQGRISAARNLFAERESLALAEWLRRVREFIPDGVYAQQDAEGRAVVRIDSVMAAFRRMVELGTIPPLSWLLEQRARVDRVDSHDAEMGEDVSVIDESVAAVRVMTIHKAKGLQGRYVIVYGWQKALDRRNERTKSKNIVSVTRKDGQPIAGFRLGWGELDIVSAGYAEAEAADRKLEAEEGARLAYVAATRAKDRLVLLSHDRDDLKEGGILAAEAQLIGDGKTPVSICDGKLSVSATKPGSQAKRGESDALEIQDEAAYARLWQERTTEFRQPRVSLLHKPSQPVHPDEEDVTDQSDFIRRKIADARDTAMEAGTLVHRYLEQHLLDEFFDDKKLSALAGASEGVTVSETVLAKTIAALKSFYGSAFHKRALRARILGREVPVHLSVDGKSWSGVIDLVMEENGDMIGIDYKVMQKPQELPDEYAQQKRIYTTALQRLFPDKQPLYSDNKVRKFEFCFLGEL